MSSQEKLLQEFLTKHPDLQQLTDAQIKSAMADMFGSGTGEQRIAYMLLRYGKLNDISSWKDVRELIDSYTHVLNVDEEMVESVITTCMNAMGKPMPTPMSDYTSQPKVTLVPYVPQQQNNRRVKVRNRAERQQQLDAHPQVPYPPYTLWENMRDYAWGGMLDFVLTTVIGICGVIFGVPAYLISLFFNYIDKSHWNMYLWCAYGALCLYALYKGIEKYIEQKNIAIRDHRGGYHDEERLQKIIADKGYTKKAEEIIAQAEKKAASIIADAESKSADLDKKTRAELKLYAEQSVNAVKTEIVNLLSDKIAADSVKAATADAKFMQGLIAKLAEQLSKNGEVIIEAKDADALKKFAEVKGIKTDFTIQPAKGGYKLAFGDAEFIAYFKEMLRPQLVEELF